jgi:hypothetical protein
MKIRLATSLEGKRKKKLNITSSSSSESSISPFGAFMFVCESTGAGGASDSPALTNGIGLKIDLVVVVDVLEAGDP